VPLDLLLNGGKLSRSSWETLFPSLLALAALLGFLLLECVLQVFA
jgi:hypothetical protein